MKPNRLKAIFAAFLALTCLIAVPQSAAALRVRLVPLDNSAPSPADVRILHAFADCTIQHHFTKVRARAALALDPTSEEYRQALVELAGQNSSCLRRGQLRFTPLPFAGGLAEGLLEDLSGPLAAHVALNPASPPYTAHDEPEVMSLCMVRAAPAEVAALFETRPASDEEMAAIRQIMPRAGECLAAGTSIRLNALSIRAMLALAAWHLAEHNHQLAAAAQPEANASR